MLLVEQEVKDRSHICDECFHDAGDVNHIRYGRPLMIVVPKFAPAISLRDVLPSTTRHA